MTTMSDTRISHNQRNSKNRTPNRSAVSRAGARANLSAMCRFSGSRSTGIQQESVSRDPRPEPPAADDIGDEIPF